MLFSLIKYIDLVLSTEIRLVTKSFINFNLFPLYCKWFSFLVYNPHTGLTICSRVAWLSKTGSPGCTIDRCDLSNFEYLARQEFRGFSIRFWPIYKIIIIVYFCCKFLNKLHFYNTFIKCSFIILSTLLFANDCILVCVLELLRLKCREWANLKIQISLLFLYNSILLKLYVQNNCGDDNQSGN